MPRRNNKKGGNGVQPFKEVTPVACEGINGAQACANARTQAADNEQAEMVSQAGGADTMTVPSFEGAANGDGAYTATDASAESNTTLTQSEANSQMDNVGSSGSPLDGGGRKRKHKSRRLHKKHYRYKSQKGCKSGKSRKKSLKRKHKSRKGGKNNRRN